MKYIDVSGSKLSNMTMGTVQLGLNYGIANNLGKPDRSHSFRMLSYALEKGVTSLDTARGYGDSEEVLGSFFSEVYKGEIPYITTKLTVGETENDAQIEQKVFASVETSLAKLRLPKVNGIMLHDVRDMRRHGQKLSAAMGKLVTKGYTDRVGVSVYKPEDVADMLKYDEYRITQLPMSLFDQSMLHTGSIRNLRDKGVTVFVRSVFLQGVFFLDPDKLEDPLLVQHAAPHIRTLRRMAEHEGMSLAQFAISFIRDIEGVSSLVLGNDTPEQVQENINLLDGPMISEKTRAEAAQAFKDVDIEGIMTVLRRPKPQN